MIFRPRLLLLVTLGSIAAAPANPITNLMYTADPSAHVFDGRLYVYPSRDDPGGKGWKMTNYHVFSTDDLKNWTDHGEVLHVKDVPWAQKNMFAPDIAFRDGKYFYYFPAQQKKNAEGKASMMTGVAIGTSPGGPFVPEPHPIAGTEGFDPSVFIDDDGQAYIIWRGSQKGKGGVPKIAKLTRDMLALDGPAMDVKGLDGFIEGPWIFKRDGTYYCTYPARSEEEAGTKDQWFAYATAKSPLGPYTYRGTFALNRGSNIHGSQIEYHGTWYAFYHDGSSAPAGDNFHRAAKVDLLEFGPDASILELKRTADGPPQIKNFDPYALVQAETMATSDVPEGPHAVTTATAKDGTVVLTEIQNGDWTKVDGADFGAGASGMEIRARGAAPDAEVVVHLDALDGPTVGRIKIPTGATPDAWVEATGPITGAKGLHDYVLEFTGPAKSPLFELDSYQFSR